MNDKERKALKRLDIRLDRSEQKKLMCYAVVILVAILAHDGDHIWQAYTWGYTIPLSVFLINIIVYILPFISIFLVKMKRFSADRFFAGPPARVVHELVGRVELLLFRNRQRHHVPRSVHTGCYLAELAVPC